MENIDSAPKDRRILLNTPAGVFIGQWVEENIASECGRAVVYAGWLTEGGETWPGCNFTEHSEQHGMPTGWCDIPEWRDMK